MTEPQRLPTGGTCDGEATHPTTSEPDAVPADVELALLPRAALKFDVVHIPVGDIFVVGPRRAVQDEAVTRIIESIEQIGFHMPITVRVQENVPHPETGEIVDLAYALVTGLHRLEACRKLGWPTIPAIVRDCSQLAAELWEINENLARAELSAEEKAEQTVRLAAVIKAMEESRDFPDFPRRAAPTTGRGHKGTVQKVAEHAGVDHSSVRHQTKKMAAVIDEPVDLDRDTPAELTRKADKYKALATDQKAKRKAERRKDREKTQATKPRQQPRLAAAIVDYNVAWPPTTFDAGMAELTDPEKADLRQHLPDVMNKHQQLADYLGLKSARAVDAASCTDQPSLLDGG